MKSALWVQFRMCLEGYESCQHAAELSKACGFMMAGTLPTMLQEFKILTDPRSSFLLLTSCRLYNSLHWMADIVNAARPAV